jgi:protocatechuate 3,4-dioxygenase beta subunit
MGAGFDTTGLRFLRGAQFTDDAGAAEFLTIYPGWYMGRTVHIHFKVRTDPMSDTGYEFTSQLFFDDDLTDVVHAQPPYAAKGSRDTRNSNDGIFQQGDEQLTLAIVEEDDGFAATIEVGVDMSVQPSPGGPGGPPPGGSPPGQPPAATPAPTPTATPRATQPPRR